MTPKQKDAVRKALLAGNPVPQVARKLKLQQNETYTFAAEAKLPTNALVKPGGDVERKILFALLDATLSKANNPVAQVAALFRQTTDTINHVVSDALTRNRNAIRL